MAGRLVECDLMPVTPLGEFLALAAGRETHPLLTAGLRYQLGWARAAWDISAPRRRDKPVLAQHVCHQPSLPIEANTILADNKNPGADQHGPPPF